MKQVYDARDARMTQGFAILCMCVLHLFCRTGDNVYGNPLFWITRDKPVVYLFGFYAEICVPLYSICAGYARAINHDRSYKHNIKKIAKLMQNYWIVLGLFSGIGLITGGVFQDLLESF